MSWKLVEPRLITSMFPQVDYAISFALFDRKPSPFISRLFHKQTPAKSDRVTNMLFAVKNLKEWHGLNIKANPKHYSLTARMTRARLISFIQDHGARLHCNSFTDVSGENFKYWIIDSADLKTDLEKWETLAASSFMHLPVCPPLDNASQ